MGEPQESKIQARKPMIQLRICQTPGCWSGADWDEIRTGGMYCGPCAAVRAVNYCIEAGYDADHIEDVFGIRHVQDRSTVSPYAASVGATASKTGKVLIPET